MFFFFILSIIIQTQLTLQRLCFQLEEAQWYYEDFVRVQNPSFPSMKLRAFSENLFNVCPILRTYISDVSAAIYHFQSYKSVIPVRGAIILNKKMTKALMVKGWKANATWGFPRGKINKNEPDELCAVREVYEEIGFDIAPYLVKDEFIEVTIRQKNFKLYIVSGVPGNTQFCPQTRKEISKIEWHNVKALPAYSSDTPQNSTKYFMVAPFMHGLAKHISKKRGLPSSLSKSETKALKNLLGVGGTSMAAQTTEQDKDAAAAELLDLLKSSSKASNPQQAQPQAATPAAQSDRTILLDLLHGGTAQTSASTSTSQAHDLESAREILSLLKTKLDRSNEEGALMEAAAPTNLAAQQGIQGMPPMMPGIPAPPPWGYMGYPMYLPPVPPGAILPQFAGAPPFAFPGYPMPVPPQGFPMAPPMPPMPSQQPEPNTPLALPNAQLAVPQQMAVFDLPRSPTQTPQPQPNSTLLALLNSRSRGKKAAGVQRKAEQPPAQNQATHRTSGSVALLSLLQDPLKEPAKEATPEPVPEVVKKETPMESASSSLMNLLRGPALTPSPAAPAVPAEPRAKDDLLSLLKSPLVGKPETSTEKVSEKSGTDTSGSALLMGLLKGNTAPTSAASNEQPPRDSVSAASNTSSTMSMGMPDESAILMGMLRGQPSSTPEPMSQSQSLLASLVQPSSAPQPLSQPVSQVQQAAPQQPKEVLTYKGGITLHDLEARNNNNFRQEPEPQSQLQQPKRQQPQQQNQGSSSASTSLLNLLHASKPIPSPTVTPSGSTGTSAGPVSGGVMDAMPRSPAATPPIGRPTSNLAGPAAGNSLLALLGGPGSPSVASPLTSAGVSRAQSVSKAANLGADRQPITSASAPSPVAGGLTEQAHLAALFSKLETTSSSTSPAVSVSGAAADAPETVTSVASVPPAEDKQNQQDLRTDLLAFLHNFSNGTLPSS